MFDSGAACPSSWSRFRQLWDIDFEYQLDACGRSWPILMVAKERRSGRVIVMRGPELRACRQAPFDIGDETLVTSYSIPAELGCFLSLTWREPQHVLCTFTECCAAINGLPIEGLAKRRPKLFEALDLFGIEHPPLSYKMQMRERGLYLLRRLLMTSSFSTVTEALGSARQSLLHTTSSLFGRLGDRPKIPPAAVSRSGVERWWARQRGAVAPF